jgi:hypothetical protein
MGMSWPAMSTAPGIEDLYGSAVLHLAWTARQDRTRHLLFGFVELLPDEVPPPIDDGEYAIKLTGGRHRGYARHLPLTVAQAVGWYEAALRGEVVRPAEDGTLPVHGAQGTLTIPPVEQDPLWPATVCADSRALLPFLSRWHDTPRVHHILGTRSVAQIFTSDEAVAVNQFVAEQFGFSLLEHPALWGSVHMVMPDPFHRSIHTSFVDADDGERLIVKVNPRRGVRTTRPPMRLTVLEQRVTGVAWTLTLDLPAEGAIELRLSRDLAATGVVVADLAGNVYRVQKPSYFIKSIEVRGNLSTGSRRVIVPRRDGAANDAYDVPVGTKVIGSPRPLPTWESVQVEFARTLDRQKVSRQAKVLQQRWFRRNRDGAERHVRDLVGMAMERVMIADLYFTHYEMARYALATRDARVSVDIITSALAFDNTDPEDLRRWIAQATADPSLGKIAVRVAGKSDLHDRFLLVDDKLYSIGGSLSELGHRGMMIIRVPDTTPIVNDLETIWSGAPSLSDWIAQRAAREISP